MDLRLLRFFREFVYTKIKIKRVYESESRDSTQARVGILERKSSNVNSHVKCWVVLSASNRLMSHVSFVSTMLTKFGASFARNYCHDKSVHHRPASGSMGTQCATYPGWINSVISAYGLGYLVELQHVCELTVSLSPLFREGVSKSFWDFSWKTTTYGTLRSFYRDAFLFKTTTTFSPALSNTTHHRCFRLGTHINNLGDDTQLVHPVGGLSVISNIKGRLIVGLSYRKLICRLLG